ncbi:hypothetical protein NC651_021915 [Populus alba x Populus x berolinensis]|nr:hypothetical protein NC651_021915 [Populus alba x Populus x berolinensis]
MLSKHPKKLQQSQKFTLASSIDKSKTSWPHHNSQEFKRSIISSKYFRMIYLMEHGAICELDGSKL